MVPGHLLFLFDSPNLDDVLCFYQTLDIFRSLLDLPLGGLLSVPVLALGGICSCCMLLHSVIESYMTFLLMNPSSFLSTIQTGSF